MTAMAQGIGLITENDCRKKIEIRTDKGIVLKKQD